MQCEIQSVSSRIWTRVTVSIYLSLGLHWHGINREIGKQCCVNFLRLTFKFFIFILPCIISRSCRMQNNFYFISQQVTHIHTYTYINNFDICFVILIKISEIEYIYLYRHIVNIAWSHDCILEKLTVTANGPEDQGSSPGRVIPKTQKMVLNAALFNTQHYKVRIKGKVEQSRERSSVLSYTLL